VQKESPGDSCVTVRHTWKSLQNMPLTSVSRERHKYSAVPPAFTSYLRALLPAQEFVPTSRMGRFYQTLGAGKSWVWVAWYTVGTL
jgi:hypothetical protein